jgi:TusA-related sulfurtransferase
MKILAHYIGTVRQFRSWLRQQKCQVVDLAEYREKKKTVSKKTATRKKTTTITTSSIPDGVA